MVLSKINKFLLASTITGGFLYANHKFSFLNRSHYSKLYQQAGISIGGKWTDRISKFILRCDLLGYTKMQNFEPELNDELNGIYLPNIIGLAAGYDGKG